MLTHSISSISRQSRDAPITETLSGTIRSDRTHLESSTTTIAIACAYSANCCTRRERTGDKSIIILLDRDRKPFPKSDTACSVEESRRCVRTRRYRVDSDGTTSLALPNVLAGLVCIAEATGAPLASKKSSHALYRYSYARDYAELPSSMPGDSGCAGMTGRLHAAEWAQAFDFPACIHELHEQHVRPESASSNAGWNEADSIPIDTNTNGHSRIGGHAIAIPSMRGTEVKFDWNKLEAVNARAS